MPAVGVAEAEEVVVTVEAEAAVLPGEAAEAVRQSAAR